VTQILEPPQSDHGAPFWDASRDERLLIPYSTETGQPFWYPREVAVDSLGGGVEWREASGRGTVYAVSVQHKPGTRPGRRALRRRARRPARGRPDHVERRGVRA
jgi:uncharacterized OB-fold protein